MPVLQGWFCNIGRRLCFLILICSAVANISTSGSVLIGSYGDFSFSAGVIRTQSDALSVGFYTGDLNVTVPLADSLVMDLIDKTISIGGDVRAVMRQLHWVNWDMMRCLSFQSIDFGKFCIIKVFWKRDILIGQLSADSVVLDMGETPGSTA